ncbi:MAG: MBL fold metallo-hydrolase [Candidatus Palauibacterales bacterium]|nr:MBL fold metallo-hydrolase [Candidatus Palauibacterales bacterium]
MEGGPVSWFVAPNPGGLTLDGTRCYAVGRDRIALIDPGPCIDGQIARLEKLAAGRAVEAVCLTHAHLDHAGIASLAAERFDAPLAASAGTLERLGVHGRELHDGDPLPVDLGKSRLTVVETPGHSSDHVSFLLEPGRAVFTGDLVLGVGSSAVLHPDGDVGSCLESFRRILSLHPGRLYPGHGPPVEDGEGRLRQYRDHRLERHQQVREAVRAGARSIEELRRKVYGDLEPELRSAADASIRAHVVHMRTQGEEVPEIGGLDDLNPTPEEA